MRKKDQFMSTNLASRRLTDIQKTTHSSPMSYLSTVYRDILKERGRPSRLRKPANIFASASGDLVSQAQVTKGARFMKLDSFGPQKYFLGISTMSVS